MNTPNKLTLLRVILVPVFLAFLMINRLPYNYIFALIVFAGASITDLLDGYLARKNDQVTTFGKFLDPLADKVLVISAMVCFIEIGLASSVAVVIIIAREFMVTSIRLVALSSDGKVISASFLGKLKTVISMVAVIGILSICALGQVVAYPAWLNPTFISNTLMWIAAAITVISGCEYLFANKSSINTVK